jgi:hypothetical protein
MYESYCFFSKIIPVPEGLKMALIKAIPLQAWTGPQVSKRLRSSGFETIGI